MQLFAGAPIPQLGLIAECKQRFFASLSGTGLGDLYDLIDR